VKLLSSKEAQPATKPFEIYDSRLPGFTLRIQPTGVRSYYARLGRSRRVALGKVGELLPDEARERCQKVLGNVAHGRHPLHRLDGADGLTLGQFVDQTYARWLKANRLRNATNSLERLNRLFSSWYVQPLSAITVERVESWKTKRFNKGRAPTTVLRDIAALSSVLCRAVKLGRGASQVAARTPGVDCSDALVEAKQSLVCLARFALTTRLRIGHDPKRSYLFYLIGGKGGTCFPCFQLHKLLIHLAPERQLNRIYQILCTTCVPPLCSLLTRCCRSPTTASRRSDQAPLLSSNVEHVLRGLTRFHSFSQSMDVRP
jgi:Arm DNA-binding domain